MRDEDYADAATLYLLGATLADLGRKHGVTKTHLLRKFKRDGLARDQEERERYRFWQQVEGLEDFNGCWTWVGPVEDGYGRLFIRGRRPRTHQVSYGWLVGPVPEGLVLDHLCRNRACVNPNHLAAVTQVENMRRGEGAPAKNARRTHCKYGHPFQGDNLIVYDNGTHTRRACRTCIRENARAYRRKVKEAANA